MKKELDKVSFLGGVSFFVLPDKLVGLLDLASTTPSVENNETWKALNTTAITVTNFKGGAIAQRLYVLGDGFTTVQYGSYIKTNTAADKLLQANKVYRFTYIDNIWFEDA